MMMMAAAAAVVVIMMVMVTVLIYRDYDLSIRLIVSDLASSPPPQPARRQLQRQLFLFASSARLQFGPTVACVRSLCLPKG